MGGSQTNIRSMVQLYRTTVHLSTTKTKIANTITLNVYPESVEEGKGNGVFKKIVNYYTNAAGQADSINDIETDYMWMKPDINVAISYSTGLIKMRYYYNFSMGEE